MSDSLVIIPTYNEKENIEKIIRAVFKLIQPFDILIVDDNPGNGSLRLFSSTGRGNAVLIFVDAIGRQYLRKPIQIISGINYYDFKSPQYLAKGTYFVRIFTVDGSWHSNTVKVILMKNY